MPLQQTSGNSTQDSYGGGVAVIPTYIEQIFSTYLYTGTGATQTITNGIDLATKGGLVWLKNRSSTNNHFLFDTVRGVNTGSQALSSNLTDAGGAGADIAFSSTGFDLTQTGSNTNGSGSNYASWTFRKQPKFFDVVTYTGTDGGSGTDSKTITHNLASTPGCIFVKRIDADPSAWKVWHTSTTDSGLLNTTGAFGTSSGLITSPRNEGYISAATNTTFTVSPGGGNNFQVNSNGGLYVAYLFAHNAGGFGATGTDNVVSCGSFTTDGSGNASVNLGYEPQYLMVKASSTTGNWQVIDNMRGFSKTGYEVINANTTGSAIPQTSPYYDPSATGFSTTGIYAAGVTVIYIAIRRGPMKVPTDATKVFKPVYQTGGGTVTTNFPVDLLISTTPGPAGSYRGVDDRLRGASTTRSVQLYTNVTDAEAVGTGYGFGFDNNTGFKDANFSSSFTDLYLNFRRAPGFFDEVCYTGTGTDGRDITHNLAAIPELMIIKSRSNARGWAVYNVTVGPTKYLYLDSTATPVTSSLYWNNTAPTASVFTVRNAGDVNLLDATYVAYLFATCPGVSKVFSFTGNGTTQTINCGFTAGARFVLLKATSATGGWFTYDTARGMTVLTDPYLQLNTTAAEVATLGSVITATTGFTVNEAITTGVNTNGVSYIGLAIA